MVQACHASTRKAKAGLANVRDSLDIKPWHKHGPGAEAHRAEGTRAPPVGSLSSRAGRAAVHVRHGSPETTPLSLLR